jgi:hypothetical protein
LCPLTQIQDLEAAVAEGTCALRIQTVTIGSARAQNGIHLIDDGYSGSGSIKTEFTGDPTHRGYDLLIVVIGMQINIGLAIFDSGRKERFFVEKSKL